MSSLDEAMQRVSQLQEVGQYAQAENIIQQILEVHPTHAHLWHLFGIIAYQDGKIMTGIERIKQAIAYDSQVSVFHSNLGEMFRLMKAFPMSIQHGQKAVDLDPLSVVGWSNLGIAYYDVKDYEQAQACHHRALAINPQLSCSLNNLGSIYKALNNNQQAMVYYQAAIEASPDFLEPLNNLAAILLHEKAFSQAYSYLNKVISMAPNFVEAHCNMGFTLLGLEKMDNALHYFERALALKPDYAEAYYGVAKIYLLRQHFIEAEHAILKAIRINPRLGDFYQCLASIYHEQGKSAQALEYLEQAFALDNASASLYLNQGSIWMDLGNLSNAEAAFARAAEDDNIENRIGAHYSLIQLRRIKTDNASFNNLLAISRDIQAVPENQLAYLYFALGKCYEDLEEWTQAFRYFSKGCQVKRSQITYNIQQQVSLANEIRQVFTPQVVDSLRNHANPSAFPIFIIGMPRSGTTLIEQIISSHPHVYGAGELKYLNEILDTPFKTTEAIYHYPNNLVHFSPEVLKTIAKKYLAYVQRFSTEVVHVTDKMPYNYMAIGVIHALLPNARIIHVKRNPLDTCLSCYTKLFTNGQYYSYDLTELGHYYRCYEHIMDHWRQLLPDDAWLEIEYETVVGNLEAEAKRLLDFCGLRWDPACLTFYQTNRTVRTASFAQVRQPVYTSSLQRWRRYENELAPLRRVLDQTAPLPNSSDDQT